MLAYMNATLSKVIPAATTQDPSNLGCTPGVFDVELLDVALTYDDDMTTCSNTPSADPGDDCSDSIAAKSSTVVSDAQLNAWIAAITEHDERALTALYDATLARVYGFVLRVVRRPAVAEEVVEETYFQVWRQAARFDPARGRALTWLLGMARSRAIDAIRHEARFQYESLDVADARELAHSDSAPDELLELARSFADLHRALMLLNAQPRQLVALAFFRGLSHEEIAGQTSLPLGTVKSQIRRAMRTLRQALA
jgi:RNA polymerase sigma factor (sigma-70 family)